LPSNPSACHNNFISSAFLSNFIASVRNTILGAVYDIWMMQEKSCLMECVVAICARVHGPLSLLNHHRTLNDYDNSCYGSLLPNPFRKGETLDCIRTDRYPALRFYVVLQCQCCPLGPLAMRQIGRMY
jgi:hypothetical protein